MRAAKGPAARAPEVKEFCSQFERISAETEALLAPLSDEQFAWQPAPDA